jgi:hypothetical protein
MTDILASLIPSIVLKFLHTKVDFKNPPLAASCLSAHCHFFGQTYLLLFLSQASKSHLAKSRHFLDIYGSIRSFISACKIFYSPLFLESLYCNGANVSIYIFSSHLLVEVGRDLFFSGLGRAWTLYLLHARVELGLHTLRSGLLGAWKIY